MWLDFGIQTWVGALPAYSIKGKLVTDFVHSEDTYPNMKSSLLIIKGKLQKLLPQRGRHGTTFDPRHYCS